MKNRFPILLILLLILAGNATGQVIPNASFETWSNRGQWGFLPRDWYGTNYSEAGLTHTGVTRESYIENPVDGQYYVKMEAKAVNIPFVGTIKVPGGITLSDLYYATGVDFFKDGKLKAGVAFGGTPSRVTGYYKYKSVNGSSYYMSAVLTKWRGTYRDTIAIAERISSQPVTEWTLFELELDYKFEENPDTMNIVFLTSAVFKESDMNLVQPGTTLEIDNLGLIMADYFEVDFTWKGNPCTGERLTFEATSENIPASRWEWYIGPTYAGNLQTMSYLFPEVTEPTNFNVRLRGVSPIGTHEVTKTVTIHPKPDIRLLPENPEICPGSTITLTATGGETYTWNTTGAFNNQITVTPTLGTVYEIIGKDQYGCTNFASSRIFFHETKSTTIQDSFCSNSSYNFHGTEIFEAGTYFHNLKTTTDCDSTITLILTENSVPALTITTDKNLVCPGSSVTLIATQGFLVYDWGNGPTSDNSITVLPSESSTFILNAFYGNGCSATANKFMEVYPASITTLIEEICEGDSIELFDKWENKAGIYSKLFTSINGCDSLVEITLVVKPSSPLQITASNDIVCSGSQVVLTATPGLEFYDWGYGPQESNHLTINPVSETQYLVKAMAPNGCISEQNYTVSIHPAYDIREEVFICPGDSARIFGKWEKTPGIYTKPEISVNGCDSVVQITLNVYEVAPIDLSASKSIICKGETVTLTSNNAFTDYSWSIPGENVNTREISPDETSSYELTVTDENQCTATGRLTITVVQSEITEVQVELCKGDSVLIDQVWRKEPGVYIEKLQGSELCEGTIRYTVTLKETPELTIEADKLQICEGEEVTITATTGWRSYQWNYGNSTGNSLSVIPENSGFITLSVVSENDCLKTDSIFIEVLPLPQPGLKADNVFICEGDTINLVANEGLSTYLWSTGDQNVSAISVTPNQSVSYKLTVTSENGCRLSDSISIIVIGAAITYRQVEICEGDSVQVANKWFKSAGVYTEEFQTSNGCSGSMEITVISNPVPDLVLMSDKETVCDGDNVTLSASVGWDNYQWNNGQGSGAVFTTSPEKSGFVSLHTSTTKGCTKTDSLFIQLLNPDHTVVNYSVCETDSIFLFNTWIKTHGEYEFTYNNLNGCDSVVIATVEVLKSPETFALSGGGEYDEEEPGRQIILEGSETGVHYRLFSTEKEESSLPGTGSNLDFGIWEEGKYWVMAENLITNCLIVAGDTINISKTGIEIPQEFRIYPNPALAEVFVSTPAEGKLRIYNSKGQIVIFINEFSSNLINLSNLDQGIYLAVLQVYTEFHIIKFIKL